MNNNKLRQEELYDYIVTMHMLCIVVYLLAVVLSNSMYTADKFFFLNIRLVLVVCLLGVGLVLYYNTKNIFIKNFKTVSFVDIIYIGFPLIIVMLILFIFGNQLVLGETLLLLPILVTSTILGKNPGLIMATLCAIILIIFRIVMFKEYSIIQAFESSLLLISLMYIIGWFLGGITNLENRYRDNLIKIAHTDILTGLYNHRYFQEQLKLKLVSLNETLSIIMIDIDYFKHYNDSYGHQAGDAVLGVFGGILNDTVKDIGFAARYGGEEFVVVLPNCDGNKAVEVAETIREKISNQTFEGEEYQPGGKLTISCGIANCPTHADNAKDLIKYADMALYRAKSLNKNKVELYFSVFDELDINENEKELVNSIRMLVSVINAKDRYTYGHSERVTDYALQLAKGIGLAKDEKRLLHYAAFLHDIGKIEIDREILNSSRRLTNEEFEILKQHPTWGSDIVKAVNKLQPAAEIILYHHENYDGSGYPTQLKGEEIPLLARVIRIADSYDAMTSNRPYKRNMSAVEALEELKRCSGTMFDPELTKKFVEIISEDQNLTVFK